MIKAAMSNESKTELQTTDSFKTAETDIINSTISNVIENQEMYALPNKVTFTKEKFQSTVKSLAEQYTLLTQKTEKQEKILTTINDLLKTENKDINWINSVKKLLEKYPEEVTSLLIKNLRHLPDINRAIITFLVIKKGSKEAVPDLMLNLEYLPTIIRKRVIRLSSERNLEETVLNLVWNLKHLPEKNRERLVLSAFEIDPKKATRGLMENLRYLSEKNRERLITLAFEKAPEEAAHDLLLSRHCLSKESFDKFLILALELAPEKATPWIMWNFTNISIEEKIVHLAFEKAPELAAYHLLKDLNWAWADEELFVEYAQLALEKAPRLAVSHLMSNLQNIPEKVRGKFARLALEKAPQVAAPHLIWNLEYLPENSREENESREEIARFALALSPKDAAPYLMKKLELFSEEVREEFISLALKLAPKEAAPNLMWNLDKVPERIREEIKDEAMRITNTVERDKIIDSEIINPILYKDLESLKKPLSQLGFIKTGTRTILLGGSLINQAIIRIIPDIAFISWMRAYSAVEEWKRAGFDYVPIEPILRAKICKDENNVKVAAGVLGLSVANYLQMYSVKEHHQSVRQQVENIRKTFQKIGIFHGHDYHEHNFCVLHERTVENKIDWDKPPRVYCIDFDRSKSR